MWHQAKESSFFITPQGRVFQKTCPQFLFLHVWATLQYNGTNNSGIPGHTGILNSTRLSQDAGLREGSTCGRLTRVLWEGMGQRGWPLSLPAEESINSNHNYVPAGSKSALIIITITCLSHVLTLHTDSKFCCVQVHVVILHKVIYHMCMTAVLGGSQGFI